MAVQKKKTSKEKSKYGRKPLYEEWLLPHKLMLIEGWSRDGLTNEQIANNMGIVPKTLYEWINRFSDISNALKINKDIADRYVENALFKSATGYEYEEVTIDYYPTKEKYIDENGLEQERISGSIAYESKRVKKWQKPDAVAQFFWLTNRKNGVWKNVNKQEIITQGEVKFNFDNVSTEQLKLVEKVFQNVEVENNKE